MSSQKQRINVVDLFSIKGKTALVTGGSSGIGLMIAQGFLEAGAKVYITSRKADVCDKVAQELSEIGPCYSIPANIATKEGRQTLLEELSKREESLSILVNNAGTNWSVPIEDYTDEAFEKVMSINVNAVFSMTRNLLPLLEKAATAKDPARVINIGSMDGLLVPTVQQIPTFAYAASKAGVHHLTRALAVDLGPRDITVNAVAPGFFPSKMTHFVFENYIEDIKNNCPLNRVGVPEEMVGIAIYLASRAGAYTNGATIPVDGGTHIY